MVAAIHQNSTRFLLLSWLSSFVIFQIDVTVIDAFTNAPFVSVFRRSNLPSCGKNHVSSSLDIPPISSATRTSLHLSKDETSDEEKIGFFDVINPFRAPPGIPAEFREEIMRAEANTQAAKDRSTRISFYILLAVVGIAIAGFNGFLTNIRLDLVEQYGESWSLEQDKTFGWTASNPVFSFLLTNGIGGGLAFLLGGFSLVFAEMEVRTGKDNALKIWKEIQRRKDAASGGTIKSTKKKEKKQKKKKRPGKEAKRLAALSEVMVEEKVESKVDTVAALDEKVEEEQPQAKEGGGGLVDKMKDLYKKADDMAAAQALLLNKKLEEEGIVEKITDESGLRVIGKEEAAKLMEEKKAKVDEGDTKKN